MNQNPIVPDVQAQQCMTMLISLMKQLQTTASNSPDQLEQQALTEEGIAYFQNWITVAALFAGFTYSSMTNPESSALPASGTIIVFHRYEIHMTPTDAFFLCSCVSFGLSLCSILTSMILYEKLYRKKTLSRRSKFLRRLGKAIYLPSALLGAAIAYMTLAVVCCSMHSSNLQITNALNYYWEFLFIALILLHTWIYYRTREASVSHEEKKSEVSSSRNSKPTISSAQQFRLWCSRKVHDRTENFRNKDTSPSGV